MNLFLLLPGSVYHLLITFVGTVFAGLPHVIAIIPHTTALGRSTRPLRGPVHEGEEGHRAGGGISGGARSTKAVREESGWKARGSQERGGPMNGLASLLLCKC